MKKSIQKLPSCGGLIALCLLFIIVVSYAASFASFYVDLSRENTEACTQYYAGVNKGTIWKYGEWHHYVDFEVDKSAPLNRWQITEAPLPSSFWRSYSASPVYKRVTYRWPSNWGDPFPASNWKICLLSS